MTAPTPTPSPAQDSPADRLLAARLLLRAHRAGVTLSWAPRMESVMRLDATGVLAEVGVRPVPGGELRYKAEPPDALTPELRAAIAALKPTILELLTPWFMPITFGGDEEKFERLVKRVESEQEPESETNPLEGIL
jgi:hypothetical protein